VDERPGAPVGPRASTRAIAVVVALALTAGGGFTLWRAFSRGPEPVPRDLPSGYYLLPPDEITVAEDNPNGGVKLVVETNLPEGTLVAREDVVFGLDPSGANSSEGYGCCQPVRDGRVVVGVDNSSCYNLVGAVGDSAGFRVTLVVAPESPDYAVGPAPAPLDGEPAEYDPHNQPPEIYELLGEHFENLTGEQVTEEGKDNVLRVTREYVWPPNSCAGTQKSFVPEECPPSDVQIQGDDLDEGMGEVMGAIGQSRLCELWQDALLPEAEAAHPWPAFRDEWLDWYQEKGGIVEEGTSHESALSWQVAERDGDRYAVDLWLRDERVGRLDVRFLPDWPASPHAIPFWGVAGYELY